MRRQEHGRLCRVRLGQERPVRLLQEVCPVLHFRVPILLDHQWVALLQWVAHRWVVPVPAA
jgi:hypothetical protein